MDNWRIDQLLEEARSKAVVTIANGPNDPINHYSHGAEDLERCFREFPYVKQDGDLTRFYEEHFEVYFEFHETGLCLLVSTNMDTNFVDDDPIQTGEFQFASSLRFEPGSEPGELFSRAEYIDHFLVNSSPAPVIRSTVTSHGQCVKVGSPSAPTFRDWLTAIVASSGSLPGLRP